MSARGPARRLTVYLGEDDTWHHRPRYAEIVRRAHQAGVAGASVFRGIEGFGSAGRVHTSRLLSLSEDLPVAVVIIDTPDRIDGLLPVIEELLTQALVVVDDVEVLGRGDRLCPDDA
jgi:PII-like signaling protein